MSTLPQEAPRPLAVLRIAALSTPDLLVAAQALVRAMTGNPSFPAPIPPLPTVGAAIDELSSAQTSTLARTHGTVPVRNARRRALVSRLEQLRTYVQAVADADPATAAGVIESAGMAVRKKPDRPPRVFELRTGPISGSIDVLAPTAAARAAYEWQRSVDGGRSWVALPATLRARTELHGFAPGTIVEVKYRSITKRGESDWSAPLAITVP